MVTPPPNCAANAACKERSGQMNRDNARSQRRFSLQLIEIPPKSPFRRYVLRDRRGTHTSRDMSDPETQQIQKVLDHACPQKRRTQEQTFLTNRYSSRKFLNRNLKDADDVVKPIPASLQNGRSNLLRGFNAGVGPAVSHTLNRMFRVKGCP